MTEKKRLMRFLAELDQMILDNSYWDDEAEDDFIDMSEEEIYNAIMKTDEYHLIGTEKVKSYIHGFVTDYGFRRSILNAFNLW